MLRNLCKEFPKYLVVLAGCVCVFGLRTGSAQEYDATTAATRKDHTIPSSELVRLAWEASSESDIKKVNKIVARCLELYEDEAKRLQAELNTFPKLSEADKYAVLNDVGTCLFIQAELLMNTGQTELAIEAFQNVINEYPLAQSWDPSRGSYWSIAEKSRASINKLQGKHKGAQFAKDIERTVPQLHTLAESKIVDYTKYGEFRKVGTKKYRYIIKDLKGLAAAVGEGIYPNTSSVYNNPRYKIVKEEGRLDGDHWDYVNSYDLEAAYFKWVTAHEPWGVRLFYIGLIFEKAEMYHAALRAYHALVVHFPRTSAWTYWQTPWYPAQAAIAKIRYILLSHPELELYDKWMKIKVENGFDNDVKNDQFVVYPGRILKKGTVEKVKDVFGFAKRSELGAVKRRLGEGKVRLEQYENGHWKLFVNDEPYVIRGITYDPTRVGETPDKGTLENWMEQDINENGLPDGPYDTWVDNNKNNRQDPDEPVVGDFQLMKEMGVNTLRFYHVPTTPHKDVLRKMFKEYGFRVILGDFLGKYAIGSGAKWSEGTDYENREHKKKMMATVKKMVMEYKDEPYILMWLLGNENNYGVASNADKKPKAYFRFANEVAKMIKSIDPDHPVALCNGDTLYLDLYAKYAPDIDIFAANVYRGNYGFGSFWQQVFDATGKPAFITEYGCPSYAAYLTREEAEQAQADYLKGNWMDIERNMAESALGVGNALGGVVFEWLDEWWKNYDPYIHDTESDAIGPFPGGYYYEEWFGLVGQGDGTKSPFLRQLKKSYFTYKEMWTK
jgi:beta-glucuronidase